MTNARPGAASWEFVNAPINALKRRDILVVCALPLTIAYGAWQVTLNRSATYVSSIHVRCAVEHVK